MKRQFVYELKRILLPLIIFTAAATLIFVVAALTSNFIWELSDGTRTPQNSLTVIPAVTLGVLCFVVPPLQFSYRMKTRSADLWYSLPVRRNSLLLQRLLAGLLLIFVPFTISFWAGFAVIAVKDNLFELQYYPALYGALIPIGIALFGTNSFFFSRANSILDGIVFELASILLLTVPFLWLNNALPYSAPDRLRDFPYCLYTLAPLTETSNFFNRLLCGHTNAVVNQAALLYSVAGVEGAVAYFGLFWTAKNHRAENIEQPSASPFGYRLMIPVYICSFSALAAADGLNLSNLVTFPLIFIAGLVFYFIFRRSFRLRLADWLWLAGAMVLGILIGLASYQWLEPLFREMWPTPTYPATPDYTVTIIP